MKGVYKRKIIHQILHHYQIYGRVFLNLLRPTPQSLTRVLLHHQYNLKMKAREKDSTKICSNIHSNSFYLFSTFSKNVSGLSGSNCSLAHITVTRSSVSDKLIMLCV